MAALFSPPQANDSTTHMVYAPHRVRANRSKPAGDQGGHSGALPARLDRGAGTPADPAQRVAHGNRALVALAIEIGEQVLIDPHEQSRPQRQSNFWEDVRRYRLALVLAGSTAMGLLVALAVVWSGLLEAVLPPRSVPAPSAMVAPPSAEQLYGYVSAPSMGAVSVSVHALAAGQEPAGFGSIAPAVAVSAPATAQQATVGGNLALDQRLSPEAAAPLAAASVEAAANGPSVSMSDVTASIPRAQTRLEERTDISASNSASTGHTKKFSQKTHRLHKAQHPTAVSPAPTPAEEARPPAEAADTAADAIERPDISGRTGSRH
jgi:hypothetical protein